MKPKLENLTEDQITVIIQRMVRTAGNVDAVHRELPFTKAILKAVYEKYKNRVNHEKNIHNGTKRGPSF